MKQNKNQEKIYMENSTEILLLLFKAEYWEVELLGANFGHFVFKVADEAIKIPSSVPLETFGFSKKYTFIGEL